MNDTHSTVGLGGMFSTLTALASPGHAALTGKPLYENVSPLGFRTRNGGPLAVMWRVVSRWMERSRQRHHLRGLSDALLCDIGLTRADVDREALKPFWQV